MGVSEEGTGNERFDMMSADEFRDYGRQVVDWLADYLFGSHQYPVRSHFQPGDLIARLPQSPPEQGQSMRDILADFEELIVPGITHWNHPGFMAYFGITGSPPGVLAEALSAGLNANAML